jgi:aldose 1-epimerase
VTTLLLRSGRLALDLAAHAGGSITRFARDGHDLMRPAATPSGKDNACYPLAPFSNRIANGSVAVDGTTIRLAPNWPGQRHPMHGDAWARPWHEVRSDDRSAEIVYEHDGSTGWPLRYRVRQDFRLDAHALAVRMSLENLEARTVPGGMGLHPFFMRDADTELAFRSEAVWLADAEVLPTERVAVPPKWDFSRTRRVDGIELDNCFTGWDGNAAIVWPSRGVRLDLAATEPFRHLVVFVPPGRNFFCVEPVSHANGAIASTRLAAGATLQGEVAFTISDL